jgi:hypothetical protein
VWRTPRDIPALDDAFGFLTLEIFFVPAFPSANLLSVEAVMTSTFRGVAIFGRERTVFGTIL